MPCITTKKRYILISLVALTLGNFSCQKNSSIEQKTTIDSSAKIEEQAIFSRGNLGPAENFKLGMPTTTA